ncbi:WD40/YVTN/BNR-like repeat-containing protein [Caenimonas soli]|uniref:WD40/YVTN/BNR-like repeat-containing protein n=1 Tax=Caenimonas soli TaxID=2735555 RepID=UPI001552CE64|nr:exo-alpha-sialidase [Caenimonas soli]NPC54543.1 exo-alpha-sialidase [Caenimonas soli]
MQVGDTVSVTGESANSWQIVQNPGQAVVTTGMAGNVAPGATWTPRMSPKAWHWISSSAGGDVLAAGAGGGDLNTSVDGGVNWTAGDSPTGLTWISSDMSASGDRIAAVQYGGGLYMSTNGGANWTQVTSTDPGVNLAAQAFESVNVSQDGQRIVVAVQNGPLYVSSNAGVNWVAGTMAAAPLNGWWRSVDSSADGMIVMAADHNGLLYRSTDGGLTWAARNVNVGGVPVSESWYRMKMSADGSVIAVAGNAFGGAPGTGIYVSHDAGLTWTKPHSLVADYTAIAMSADGQIIGVTASGGGSTGRVLRSTDGGASFTEVTMPGTDTNWRAMAMSSDGNRLAVAAGLFAGAVTGQLYTSGGNRTDMGTLGSITGGQGLSAELEYIGGGLFKVRSSAGGTFSIQ